MDETYIFVPFRIGNTNDREIAKEKTEIRSHASLKGYRNSQRRKAKAAQIDKRAAEIQIFSANPISAAVNALIPASIRLRVTVKNKRPPLSSLNRSSSSDTSTISHDSSISEIEIPSPERLISAELNAPRYLYIWTQQVFPDYKDFSKCFNVEDVHILSAVRPYLDHQVFESTLASLSHAISNFHAGTDNLTSKDVLSHRGKAIRLLRSHLDAEQVNSAVLLTILYMILLEMYLDNTQATETHKKVLRHLVQRHGGLESLDEHIIGVILQQNEYWVQIGLSPIIEVPSVPIALEYPTAETLTALHDAITYLPLGFRQLAISGEIATCNLEFLFRITEFHRDQRNQRTPSSLSSGTSSFSNTSRHRYRSVIDALPVLAIPDSDTVIFQKLFCHALIIYSMTCLNKPAIFIHHMIDARAELTMKLPSVSKRLTPFYHQEQCLFWIWQIAVTSWDSELEGVVLGGAQRERFKSFYDDQRTDVILGNFLWAV